MKPPYQITPQILSLTSSISEKLGEVKSAFLHKAPTELRKKNRVRTIQSSLEIEGNTLTIEQVTAVLENKHVLAPEKDILEVKNAIAAYERIGEYNPFRLDALLQAHQTLMHGLVGKAGKLRTTAVGIARGEAITHLAPPSEMLSPLLHDLFDYLENDPDILLIKSCVFHYEFEFIHPFTDGNGRMGRLWQTVILRTVNPVFEFLPIESLIKKNQASYYEVLGKADSLGSSTPFIEFLLGIIDASLDELLQGQNIHVTTTDRIELFKTYIGQKAFSRSDYLRHFKGISTATASRDLKQATTDNILLKKGDGRTTTYHYIN
ncbi:MAG: Fic family protein [Paludibacteraceae bacterium]|nr:Fic family protein [Paludibacteraceae bacterium]